MGNPAGPHRGGRPTDLTLELAERCAIHVRHGNTLRCAAALEMVPWSTFTNWLKRGREEHEPYVMFLDLIRQAEAFAESSAINRIEEAGERGDWKADAWRVERRYREDWWLIAPRPGDESKLPDTELVLTLEKLLDEARERIAKADGK